MAMSLMFGIIFTRTDYFFSQVILGAVIVLQMIEMIHFARRSIRELRKFILAIKYGDVSVNFSGDRLGRDFRDLADSFREVVEAFHKVKIEKESQYLLLQAIIDKISFGIIAFNEDDEILLINQSAINHLKIERTKEWNYVKKHNAAFTDQIEDMAENGRKLVELGIGSEIRQLSVYNHSITLTQKYCRVITFYDIQDEIEQKEIEAWYKLIRILTHEIMNSATPLTSLTDTILMLLENQSGMQKKLKDISEENIKDVRSSVNTIKKRTEGILQFVEAYRKLTDIPHPKLIKVKVEELINSVLSLLEPELRRENIKTKVTIDPKGLQLKCDKMLLEQVMINLLTNSIYALKKEVNPMITINIYEKESKALISIEDNGRGIEEEVLKKIFIPFFSTRDGGSGIGLSFSKFVILQHGGRIRAESKIDKGAIFIIELPN